MERSTIYCLKQADQPPNNAHPRRWYTSLTWMGLTYLAALHPELMWGHTVLCQSFRNPALVAKMGATLHFMSGGRFILGMGADG
jgi:alkanesulfonate monooxygenase SsuD/methylene tetrahydromethanopterin reductase-like flavin-dependent oxidoreductase (luciferase family)